MNKKQRTANNKKKKAERAPIERKDTGKEWVGFNTHIPQDKWIQLSDPDRGKRGQETQTKFIYDDNGVKKYTYQRDNRVYTVGEEE